MAPEAVLGGRACGRAVADEKILLTTEHLFAFWRAVADECGDPDIGLRLGSEDRTERYDPILLAALSASSFRDAIERAWRYKQLTCPEEIGSSRAAATRGPWSSSGCSSARPSHRRSSTCALRGCSARPTRHGSAPDAAQSGVRAQTAARRSLPSILWVPGRLRRRRNALVFRSRISICRL